MTPLKRTMDIVFSILLMVILFPVFAGLLIWLLRTQGRPLFYAAERMKSPTEGFRLWKFRTMTVADADSGVSGGDKISRITPVGARLRAKRLDEIPQLWNILKGDISFVGPRPPLRSYVTRFPKTYDAVLKSKPGVTGLATLTFHRHETELLSRSATPAETDEIYCRVCIPKKAKLDLIYQKNQSICYDFLLVFQTIGELFSRTPRSKGAQKKG
ncbi:sugar transferase [Aestuariivita sp.]|jgi:lipopolysaccharide/colanic/teichoic acid biosynthesis glycosyltransferase|uniref:sugar transferase n=1 Tax=Aestuariivita sp. TaxID=1872407 RepID=UPI00216F113A|nr:sugar transferase [Aestuariivita sp.]MCE8005553.1 sugar transferase [Aestuariivita sp.]